MFFCKILPKLRIPIQPFIYHSLLLLCQTFFQEMVTLTWSLLSILHAVKLTRPKVVLPLSWPLTWLCLTSWVIFCDCILSNKGCHMKELFIWYPHYRKTTVASHHPLWRPYMYMVPSPPALITSYTNPSMNTSSMLMRTIKIWWIILPPLHIVFKFHEIGWIMVRAHAYDIMILWKAPNGC